MGDTAKMISKPLLFHKPVVNGGDEQILLRGSSSEVSEYICVLTVWARGEFRQGLSGLMRQNRQNLSCLIWLFCQIVGSPRFAGRFWK